MALFLYFLLSKLFVMKISINNFLCPYYKNVGKYKKFDVYYFIIKNEKDINPSYGDNHKANADV